MVELVVKRFGYDSPTERFIVGLLSDSHVGNGGADLRLFRRSVEWCRAYADAVMFGGDASDAIDVKDKRFDWGSIDRRFATPKEQYREFERLLAPVADKLIWLGKGNHDEKLDLLNGSSYMDDLAEKWGVKTGISAFIRLNFNRGRHHRSRFDIYAHHGKTGATTKGGKLNKARSLDQVFDADIYAMSHVHDVGQDAKPVLTVTPKGVILQRRRFYVLTGGFLKGYEEGVSGYVERAMLAPTSLGGMFLSLEKEKAKLPVIIGEIPVGFAPPTYAKEAA